ncbi:MAG: hypothetical protein K5770_11230 [Lachnospiraceae bacterium]|nr:hypothetical protein [Lachnospiraceae bacterium]
MKDKKIILVTAAAVIHLLVTFYTDRFIFTAAPDENPVDYVICKVITFCVLFAFYYGLYLMLFIKKEKEVSHLKAEGARDEREISLYRRADRLRGVIKCAAPYIIVAALISVFKLRGGYLSNDETLICQNALTLTHYTWFYYITTYFYIVSFMLIPHIYGPIFIKLVIELLVVGYVAFRIRTFLGKGYGYASYLLFLLYPVLAYTTSAHRLPVYFLVYLYFMTVLLFDKLEGGTGISRRKILWLVFLSAVLTQWRTEGIYFAVISVILMLFAYTGLRNGKNAAALIVTALIVQYAVSIPQNGLTASELSAKADDRMKPFYAYTVTNMFRNGLDREKNKEDIEIIDRYLSVETIDAINEYYGDINYEDVLILYADGFVGTREEASVEDFFNYADACKRLFVNNADVLIRTRWGAFCYAALPYHIEYTGTGLRELFSFGLSVVKTVSYNLFIPVMIVVLLCLYSLIRRRWYTFFVTGGLIAHLFIVFVLAPASYFKYYFPVYIMAYFYVMLIIMQIIYDRRNERKVDFIL